MLQKILQAPTPLLRKPFGALLLGMALLVVGVVFFVSAGGDRSFLIISLLLTGYCLFHGVSLFRHIYTGSYTVLEGDCFTAGQEKLSGARILIVREESGEMSTVRLRRTAPVVSGARYRFYFIGGRADDRTYGQGKLWAMEEIAQA